MVVRLLVLAAAVAVAAVVLGLYARYRRGASVERLDVEAVGIATIAAPFAFVVFTTPGCRPCGSALGVIRAAAGADADVVTVDAAERTGLAATYSIRSVPTIFLVTASGHVVRRWTDVPDRNGVERALAELRAAA